MMDRADEQAGDSSVSAPEGTTDWTGVRKERREVAPLTAETFVERLKRLSARANDVRRLRAAMQESQRKP